MLFASYLSCHDKADLQSLHIVGSFFLRDLLLCVTVRVGIGGFVVSVSWWLYHRHCGCLACIFLLHLMRVWAFVPLSMAHAHLKWSFLSRIPFTQISSSTSAVSLHRTYKIVIRGVERRTTSCMSTTLNDPKVLLPATNVSFSKGFMASALLSACSVVFRGSCERPLGAKVLHELSEKVPKKTEDPVNVPLERKYSFVVPQPSCSLTFSYTCPLRLVGSSLRFPWVRGLPAREDVPSPM